MAEKSFISPNFSAISVFIEGNSVKDVEVKRYFLEVERKYFP